MAVPVHPEDPAPDQPQTPPAAHDLLQARFVLNFSALVALSDREIYSTSKCGGSVLKLPAVVNWS